MTFSLYEASAPVFVAGLTNLRAWFDKADAHREAELVEARLAPDMRPLAAQVQMASDRAKNAVARLCGLAAPAMPDTETSFAELRARCDRTIAFVQGVAPDAYRGSEDRGIVLRFADGAGYRFVGRRYLTDFALPNFQFHVVTAHAMLRAAGVPLGKPDFLAHVGAPEPVEPA